jgi:hypothetical protein
MGDRVMVGARWLVADLRRAHVRRLLAACMAMIGSACASHGALAGYSRGTIPSHLDDADASLLRAMSVAEPTPDALAARERIGELEGVGSADLNELLVSSIGWLDQLRRSGALDGFEERCVGSETKDGGDVIGELATAPVLDPGPTGVRERLGIEYVWSVETETPECRRAYAILRALALTRAWLGANVDEPGVLEPFRRTVEAIVGAPAASDCTPTEADEVLAVVVRHLAELDPFEPAPFDVPEGACVAVSALSGAVPTRAAEAPPSIRVSAPRFFQDGDAAIPIEAAGHGGAWSADLMLTGWHGGDIHTYWVVRLGGEWRVVSHEYGGQVCLSWSRG